MPYRRHFCLKGNGLNAKNSTESQGHMASLCGLKPLRIWSVGYLIALSAWPIVNLNGAHFTDLGSTDKTEMNPGDVFVIETPGGGGFGKVEEAKRAAE